MVFKSQGGYLGIAILPGSEHSEALQEAKIPPVEFMIPIDSSALDIESALQISLISLSHLAPNIEKSVDTVGVHEIYGCERCSNTHRFLPSPSKM